MTLKTKLIGVLIALGLIVGAYRYHQWVWGKVHAAEASEGIQKRINDSTVILLSNERLNKERLQTIVDAGNYINGKPVAGISITIPQRDTVIKWDTLETRTTVDEWRTAKFEDSTFAGTVVGTITAPPCCAPLGLEYTITRPEFSPQIGFVKRGQSVYGVVSWRGEEVEITASYYKLPPAPPKTIGYWAEAGVNFEQQYYLRGGMALRLPLHIQAQAGVDTRGELFAGIRKDW